MEGNPFRAHDYSRTQIVPLKLGDPNATGELHDVWEKRAQAITKRVGQLDPAGGTADVMSVVDRFLTRNKNVCYIGDTSRPWIVPFLMGHIGEKGQVFFIDSQRTLVEMHSGLVQELRILDNTVPTTFPSEAARMEWHRNKQAQMFREDGFALSAWSDVDSLVQSPEAKKIIHTQPGEPMSFQDMQRLLERFHTSFLFYDGDLSKSIRHLPARSMDLVVINNALSALAEPAFFDLVDELSLKLKFPVWKSKESMGRLFVREPHGDKQALLEYYLDRETFSKMERTSVRNLREQGTWLSYRRVPEHIRIDGLIEDVSSSLSLALASQLVEQGISDPHIPVPELTKLVAELARPSVLKENPQHLKDYALEHRMNLADLTAAVQLGLVIMIENHQQELYRTARRSVSEEPVVAGVAKKETGEKKASPMPAQLPAQALPAKKSAISAEVPPPTPAALAQPSNETPPIAKAFRLEKRWEKKSKWTPAEIARALGVSEQQAKRALKEMGVKALKNDKKNAGKKLAIQLSSAEAQTLAEAILERQ